MNLRSKMTTVGAEKSAPVTAGFFRQIRPDGLFSPLYMKSMFLHIQFCPASLFLLALVMTSPAVAQTNSYGTNGAEYALAGSLPGDQVFPSVAISTNGGFVVWQDNATDGDSWGISATRLLNSSLSQDSTWSDKRVNIIGAGSQEQPRVALLKNNGAVIVWQGGKPGYQHIYARFVTPAGLFLPANADIVVSTPTNNYQINPAVAVLNNSNVVVVWSSYNQATTNRQNVYGTILSPNGTNVVKSEFLVSAATQYNQRSPAVAALPKGGFVVAWVAEGNVTVLNNITSATNTAASLPVPSADIYAQLFDSNNVASGSKFQVNTNTSPADPCARPAVAAAGDGGIMVTWCQRDLSNYTNSWDIYGRACSDSGVLGAEFRVNNWTYGDQYHPSISAIGTNYLAVWTSLGQDGSSEGVYGRFINRDGSMVGNSDMLVNTTTVSRQIQPAVASDRLNHFIVVWTSYVVLSNNFDLFAQQYINGAAVLPTMSAPFVWAPFVLVSNKYQPQLVVSWSPMQGLSISNYAVYVDGATTKMATVTSNQWTMTAANGLTADSTHSFQVDYLTTDGRRPSALSPSSSGTTWGGLKWGTIPSEWMEEYYGDDASVWPVSTSKPDGSSLTLYQIFLSGGDPLDSTTWLQTTLSHTSEGMFLGWNTQPGAMYQVQVTTDFNSWSNVGTSRFAAGTTDSINVGGSPVGYYRVMLLRN
jgi:hypothetical protein